MNFSGLFKIAFPFALLTLAPGCGGDEPGGDGDGDTSSGGQVMGSGGAATGGGSATGGSTTGGSDGTGGGEFIDGSGTVSVSFNGTPVEFEIYDSVDLGESLGLVSVGNSTNSESVSSVSLTIVNLTVGTYDCTDGGEALIRIQALDSEEEPDSFESRGTSACTLNLTEIGGPGEPVRGTFSGELRTFLGETATIQNGSFDIVQGSP